MSGRRPASEASRRPSAKREGVVERSGTIQIRSPTLILEFKIIQITETMIEKRTIGLSTFSVIQIFIGFYVGFYALSQFTPIADSANWADMGYYRSVSNFIHNAETLIFSLFMILVGLGTFYRRKWARVLNLCGFPIFLFLFFAATSINDSSGVHAAYYSFSESIKEVMKRQFYCLFSSSGLYPLTLTVIIYFPVILSLNNSTIKKQFV